ncbi:MAG: divergent polysaccharide deacetylase family protein [Campylobacterales bacterium]
MPKSRKKSKKTKKGTSSKKRLSFFSKLQKPLLISLPIVLILIATTLYLFLENPEKKLAQAPPKEQQNTIKKVDEIEDENIKKLQEILTSNKIYEKKKSILDKEDEEKAEATDLTNSEIKDFKDSKERYEETKKAYEPLKKVLDKDQKPKLAIVIDDVAFSHQIERIKSIDLEITPSLMPRSSIHPDTPRLAKRLPFYMIHLPLEAINYANEEKETLKVGDSDKKIESIIKKIRNDFPNSKYINNHTGSKFTADYNSMYKLIKTLDGMGFAFVDSRTTANSKAKEVSASLSLKLLSRDVFIDNKAESNYIRGQLKEAVKKAKKNGYALAIGHPSRITLETIRDSKDILEGIDVVYLDKLYDFVYN